MRPTKKDIIDYTNQSFADYDCEHTMRASTPILLTQFAVLNFYKGILQSITNCSSQDIKAYDVGYGIQGYEVETSYDDQTQNFVRVDCIGINVEPRCRHLWKAKTMCQFLTNKR